MENKKRIYGSEARKLVDDKFIDDIFRSIRVAIENKKYSIMHYFDSDEITTINDSIELQKKIVEELKRYKYSVIFYREFDDDEESNIEKIEISF